MSQTQSAPSARAQLRRILAATFITDEDFVAFCMDHFPTINARFTKELDRTSKTNLLLQFAEPKELAICLKENCPIVNEKFPREISDIIGDLREQHRLQIESDLELALLHRENLIASHADTTEIDKQILSIRRQQRNGPLLSEGEVLSGRYKLLEIIGRGGFADVWQAFDRKYQRIVAAKVLHAQWANDRSLRERFERGARRMATLNHPHIVRVLSEPMEEEGYLFFTMEYHAGGDLGRALVMRKSSVKEMLINVVQVGRALEHAHHCGLIHRDVKPQNILLDRQGHAHLSDFDLVGGAVTSAGTRTAGLGSFVFSAPEQLEDASRVDARADVYSLGMVALSILAGNILPIHVLRDIDRYIDQLIVGERLKRTISCATAWDAHSRFGSMQEFCRSLERAIELAETTPGDNTNELLSLGKWHVNTIINKQLKRIRPTTADTLKLLPGLWKTDSGSTYCIDYVDGEIRCAYCYGGDNMLTGHFFDYKIIDDQVFGRFRWISQRDIKGYNYLRLISAEKLMGGWFYADDVDDGTQDVSDKVEAATRTLSWYPVVINRVSGTHDFPRWAMEYFDNRMWMICGRF